MEIKKAARNNSHHDFTLFYFKITFVNPSKQVSFNLVTVAVWMVFWASMKNHVATFLPLDIDRTIPCP